MTTIQILILVVICETLFLFILCKVLYRYITGHRAYHKYLLDLEAVADADTMQKHKFDNLQHADLQTEDDIADKIRASLKARSGS